jgi:hypothetical protein
MTNTLNTKKEKAILLRSRGKSYGEIMKILGILSKGTLNYWFRDLKLNDIAKKRLKRITDQTKKKNLIGFNKRRTKAILKENKSIYKESERLIGRLSKRELLLIGVSLYWGEGVNKALVKGYQLVTFVNSDPNMVIVFIKFLREILCVEDNKIKPGIIIHPNVDANDAVIFWSHLTGLPKEQFWVSVAVSKASKHKRPSHSLVYGTIHLRVNNRRLFCMIRGYISGISKNISKSNC